MKLEEVNTRTKEAVDFLVAALESGHSEVLTAYLTRYSTVSIRDLCVIWIASDVAGSSFLPSL